jgi:transcriptional regulator with XRE-family HTH domain
MTGHTGFPQAIQFREFGNRNMSEKTIAARIKMARKMAGFNTQAALLEQIGEWSPSRLGNYEAGISMPGPQDVLRIAEATESSPCWLMFGLGPIRPDHRDRQAIRHQNLCNSIHDLESSKAALNLFLKAARLDEQKLESHLDNPFLPISDALSRRIEKHLKQVKGWMDEQHVENDPVCRSFPDDIRELMALYSSVDADRRSLMLNVMRTLANGS